jgi:PKD repeat protein
MTYSKSFLMGDTTMLNLKRMILTLSFLFFFGGTAFAKIPVIFFSDLESGPKTGWEGSATKGCAVTIWGKNFGESRGANYVTACGTDLTSDSYYAEWGVTANNARGMERITFWLNSSCNSGAGTISVTVDGSISNTVPFTVRSGNIRFVTTSGNNSYNGQYATYQGESDGPWATPNGAKMNMSAGDITYFRAGNYNTGAGSRAVLWFDSDGQGGTTNNPKAFISYPGETATIMDGGTGCYAIGNSRYTNTDWVVFSKFALDGNQGAFSFISNVDENGMNHLRVVGNDMTGNRQNWDGCVTFQGNMEDLRFYGNIIRDYGSANYHNHGLYLGGYGEIDDVDVGWNEVYGVVDGRGIQIYGHEAEDTITNLIVHDNLIHHNEKDGILFGGGDGGAGGFVKDALIYNNIIHSNNESSDDGGFPGLRLNSDAGDFKIYNNTFYNNGSINNEHQIWFRNAHTVMFKNNIIYGVGGQRYIKQSEGVPSAVITASNNMYWGGGDIVPAYDSSSAETDPKLTDPGHGDFSLQSNSPAVAAGQLLDLVLKDYDGISRPQGSKYDIGAIEFNFGDPAPEGPEIQLSATSHDYGSVLVGSSSDWKYLTISNVGTEKLIVSSVASDNPDFTVISPAFPQDINPGESRDVEVRFSPSSAGAITGNLTVNSNDADEPSLNISLSGTGVEEDTELPVAEAGNDKTALAGVSVSFNGSSSSDNVGITSYQWDFDDSDGIQIDATGVTASHTYDTAGTYTVTLTVDDAAGNGPVSDTLTVTVEESTGTITSTFGDATGSDYTDTCSDTYVNVGQGGSVNYSTDNVSLNTYTWPVNTVANRIVMKWDVSAIPSNATIHSATLSLYMYGYEEGGGDDQYDISVHKIVNHNPYISGCTWNTYDGVNAWTGGANGGAQDMAGAEDTNTLDKTPGYKSWTVTNMVQDWVTNPSSIFGLMFDSDSTASNDSNRDFRPTEFSNPDQRPKLVVTYTIGDDTIPPGDVSGFTATAGAGQVSLSWTNPTDSDFAGVMIRYRTDGTYPTNYTDGTAVPNGNGGKIPGQPNASGSYVHTGLDYNLTYYYSAFSYDTSGNYSDTAHASAKPLPALSISTSSLPNGIVDSPYNETLLAQGGVSPYTWILESGSLPAGLMLSSSGTISGTPTAEGTQIFSVKVTDSEASADIKQLSITVTAVPLDMVAYWSLDEDSGTVAEDVSGHGNELTIIEASWVSGYTGSALSFDGNQDYAFREDSDLIGAIPAKSSGGPEDFTLTAWVKFNSVNARRPIISKQGNGTRGFVFLMEDSNKLSIQVFNDGGTRTEVFSSASLQAGQGYHVAATYDYVSDGNSRIRLRK